MVDRDNSRSLREIATFELVKRGYDPARVDAFLEELETAFSQLEDELEQRSLQIAALERALSESAGTLADKSLAQAEEKAEEILTSALQESAKILDQAEIEAIRISGEAWASAREHQRASSSKDIHEKSAREAGIYKAKAEKEATALIAQARAEAQEIIDQAHSEAQRAKAALDAEAKRLQAEAAEEAARLKAEAEERAKAEAEELKAAAEAEAEALKEAARAREQEDRDAAEASPGDMKSAAIISIVPNDEFDDDEDFNEDVDLPSAKDFDWSAARAAVLAAKDDPLDEVVELDHAADVDEKPAGRSEMTRYEKQTRKLPRSGEESGSLDDLRKLRKGRGRRKKSS